MPPEHIKSSILLVNIAKCHRLYSSIYNDILNFQLNKAIQLS